VNSIVKRQAEEDLSELGKTMSTMMNMYLKHINLTGGIPIFVELPKMISDKSINEQMI